AMARNNGIKISRGRIILFLDGDMVPALDTLRKHVEAHTGPRILVAGNRKWRGALLSSPHLPTASIEEVVRLLENDSLVDDKSQRREEIERQRRKAWFVSRYPWRVCLSSNVSVEWSPEVYFDESFIGWGPEDWEFSHRLCVEHNYSPVYRDDITAYHLETPGAVGNVFRTGAHEEIVRYMQTTFYFFSKCSDLPLDEVFFGFPRFVLDPATNMWRVMPRPSPDSYDLEKVVERAKRWLTEWKSKVNKTGAL
ncbi:MAG: glycosyltransferase, partial [bacterium]